MCVINENIILSESKDIQISWCKKCQSYTLIHKSSFATFNSEELKHFKSTLEELKHTDYKFSKNGNRHVLIRNAKTAIGIFITEVEKQELLNGIRKALTLSELFEIIYSPNSVSDE
ncbi:DUF6686 family protein [Reichenbachiella versicolor]|uniref:DUF6686 family protein n=1 Tax=Reichenbachiella versicolor TaxID=1821036 RepID=UPI003742EE3C